MCTCCCWLILGSLLSPCFHWICPTHFCYLQICQLPAPYWSVVLFQCSQRQSPHAGWDWWEGWFAEHVNLWKAGDNILLLLFYFLWPRTHIFNWGVLGVSQLAYFSASHHPPDVIWYHDPSMKSPLRDNYVQSSGIKYKHVINLIHSIRFYVGCITIEGYISNNKGENPYHLKNVGKSWHVQSPEAQKQVQILQSFYLQQ